MKAAVYDQLGGPEMLRYEEVAELVVRQGGLVMEVKAIGLQGGDLITAERGSWPAIPTSSATRPAASCARGSRSELTISLPGSWNG
jgi:NADPH:quinone reductase-like Zn-dependent oxidoreductase